MLFKIKLKQKDIDGLLVGGASLDPGHFLEICELVSEQAVGNGAVQ